MEGSGAPLPEDKAPKKSMNKMIVAIVVVILVVAAIGGALLLTGGKQENKGNPPVAKVATTTSIVDPGQTAAFTAAGSTGENTIVSYKWDFGDGTTATTSTIATTHNYYLPGTYLTTVTAVDSKNLSGTSWDNPAQVVVNTYPTPSQIGNGTQPLPIVAFSSNVVISGTQITFNGKSSLAYTWNSTQPAQGDNIKQMVWTFGDGSSAVGTWKSVGLVNHTYVSDQGAMFMGSLTVVSVMNATNTVFFNVVIQPKSVTPGGVAHPDTFINCEFGEPQSLDPAWDYETSGGEILQNVYETLVAWDGNSTSTLKPVLATEVPTVANGGISADGLTYTFHLRHGVTFHDGVNTMTADDVIYSITRVLEMNDLQGPAWMLGVLMLSHYPGLGRATNLTEIANSMTKVDDFTVQFHLLQSYPGFLSIMAYTIGSVVSKNFVQAHGGLQPLKQNTFMNRNEDGTGPYKLRLWSINDRIVMERWDGYWKTPASIKYVEIKKVQDTSTREMYLLSGQADAVFLQNNQLNDVRGRSGVLIYERLPALLNTAYSMNEKINVSSSLPIGDIPSTFFADVNIRRAMAAAFDYQTFLNYIQGGAIQPNGPIPKGMFGYDPSLPTQQYNLAKAAQYLKAAVDTRPGHTGSYADNGFTLNIWYNAANVNRQAACQLMKKGLELLSQNATAGVAGKITVNLQTMDWPAYLDARAAGNLPMYILGWSVDYPDPDDFANPYCYSGGAYPAMLGFANATLDSLVFQAASTTDQATRQTLYNEITTSTIDNAYYIWVSQGTNNAVMRTWVHGYIYNPTHANYPGIYYDLSKS